MRFVLLLFAGLFLYGSLPGQELVFCLDHTREGAPLARSESFDLDRFGQNLDMVFRNRGPIRTSKLYFFIDIERDGQFLEFDTKTVVPGEGVHWAAIQYHFERSGRYRVMVMNAEKEEICRGEVSVNIRNDENSPEYFEGAKVVFCNVAAEGVADTLLDAIRVPSGGSRTLSVLLQHNRALKTDAILVDVWVGAGEAAGLYLETVAFSVNGDWSYTQFPYEFRSAGVYTFRIYNEHEIWIASSKLEVMME